MKMQTSGGGRQKTAATRTHEWSIKCAYLLETLGIMPTRSVYMVGAIAASFVPTEMGRKCGERWGYYCRETGASLVAHAPKAYGEGV